LHQFTFALNAFSDDIKGILRPKFGLVFRLIP
jgi:hypothetical protein